MGTHRRCRALAIQEYRATSLTSLQNIECLTLPATMRLINTRTFELKEFSNPKTRPRYAILSHRWLEDEISFQHMQNLAQYRHLDGYSKLAWFCYKAREYGYEWGWQDTCCINDANLMEKSEAINSMFA